MSAINDRIIQIAEHFRVAKPADFARLTGFSHQVSSNYLKGLKKPSIDALENIQLCFDSVSPNWLLTGRGPMLKEQESEMPCKTHSFKLRTDNDIDKQLIPLYNLEAAAGLVGLFNSQNDTAPVDHLLIPNLPKCDGAIFVTGDSMYPLLKSGDIVAYKEIHDLPSEIFWGEMYIVSIEVAGEEFVSVKYVQKSELGPEYITLVSYNQHHAPKDVHLNKVRAMALVKASVRINSMS